MKDAWREVAVTKIHFALYVAPSMGSIVHKDRAYHGFVLNDGVGIKEYFFSDGRVLRVEGETLFYLPKHSSYRVRTVKEGGCYAINFEAGIDDEPFSAPIREFDALKKSFHAACAEWKTNSAAAHAAAMRAIYDAICMMQRERVQGGYLPRGRTDVIAPALEMIDRSFADGALSVAGLAKACGMSEVYFRKLFRHRCGASPKEYLIQRRMTYARQLLDSGEISVQSVALLCGYGEECHFSREFRRRFGVSPSEYKGRRDP